jgi:hypothetical protein
VSAPESPTLFDYEAPPIAHARHRDPPTSKEAAKSVKVPIGQGYVLAALAEGPRTDEEILAWIHTTGSTISASGPRTRRAELVAAAAVRFTGTYKTTESGRKTQVWERVPTPTTRSES